MTNPLITGYLETGYLEESPYLGGTVQDFYGMQVQRVIQSSKPVAVEVLRLIQNYPAASGLEVDRAIADTTSSGLEVDRAIGNTTSSGMEVNRVNAGAKSMGLEVRRISIEDGAGNAMEIRMDHSIAHWLCDELGYLSQGYLETPYLVRGYCAQSGMEITRTVASNPATGVEINRIVSSSQTLGVEIQRVIDATKSTGMEVARFINTRAARGVEVDRVIRADKKIGMEIIRVIQADKSFGMEIDRLFASSSGFQVRVVLYNIDKLRILCDFSSRGADGAGLNMWGQAKGDGLNWGASSTAAGDFSVNNLNTDIVEQVWRSNGATTAVLTCDTEVNQGVPVDTIGIMNHNLTSSAVVTFESSDDSGFSPIQESVGITVDKINMFYIAPTFPSKQWRYRRINISDPTNPAGYLQIGTVIFGSSAIFTKEDMIDEIIRRNKHFADRVRTEGFTNVSNDRALKRAVQLSFESLPYNGPDLKILLDVFEEDRTSLKCLWIPDPRDPKRFAVFGKIAELPDERHRKMGPNEADVVTLAFDVDESL